jgi:hypothetical protein
VVSIITIIPKYVYYDRVSDMILNPLFLHLVICHLSIAAGGTAMCWSGVLGHKHSSLPHMPPDNHTRLARLPVRDKYLQNFYFGAKTRASAFRQKIQTEPLR